MLPLKKFQVNIQQNSFNYLINSKLLIRFINNLWLKFKYQIKDKTLIFN